MWFVCGGVAFIVLLYVIAVVLLARDVNRGDHPPLDSFHP